MSVISEQNRFFNNHLDETFVFHSKCTNNSISLKTVQFYMLFYMSVDENKQNVINIIEYRLSQKLITMFFKQKFVISTSILGNHINFNQIYMLIN